MTDETKRYRVTGYLRYGTHVLLGDVELTQAQLKQFARAVHTAFADGVDASLPLAGRCFVRVSAFATITFTEIEE